MEYAYMTLNAAIDLGLIFGPTSAYFFQYRLIAEKKSLGTFSVFVCAILIFCNILRIYFWFGHPYDFALFLQSLVMITVQIFLLKECIRFKPGRTVPIDRVPLKERFKIKNLWRWDDYGTYIDAILIVWSLVTILTLILVKNKLYMELIGYASVITEASLGFPQFLSNLKNKSTAGLSIGLILVWFAGDAAKTVFYVVKNQPLQFIICGAVQLAIDVGILAQIFFYGQQYKEVATGKEANESAIDEAVENKPASTGEI